MFNNDNNTTTDGGNPSAAPRNMFDWARKAPSMAYGSTLGVQRSDSNFASKVNAELARRDWEDYQKTFMPIHGIYKDAVMSDKLVNEQLARVPGNITGAFASAKQNADLRMQRMGLADADMGRTDLSVALQTSGAENNIRQHAKDRSRAALIGAPLPTAGQGG